MRGNADYDKPLTVYQGTGIRFRHVTGTSGNPVYSATEITFPSVEAASAFRDLVNDWIIESTRPLVSESRMTMHDTDYDK